MTIEEISTVCFVGAGTMGCYNSLVAALAGYTVTVYDRNEDVLQQVPDRHAEWASILMGAGYCTEEDVSNACARVTVTSDMAQAVANADLVSESIFEQAKAKRDMHAQLDIACAPHTILTSNSSNILISQIEGAVTRGDRFAALHSYLGSPLFDIVGVASTSPAIIETLVRYVESLGCVPLVQHKEYPGYVLNAMIVPVLVSALGMLIDDDLTPQQIDRAWMLSRNATMGPCGMMDMFGLNVIYDSWQRTKSDARRQRLQPAVLALLKPLVEAGKLGAKTGEGFYRYPNADFQSDSFLQGQPPIDFASDALTTALVTSALLLAHHGIASRPDIDMAWTLGAHLETGPFEILAKLGNENYLELLQQAVQAGRINEDDALVARQNLN
ncbi:MAG: 3-hydroxyacyl-CoA dehydrogenase NAD-binding domain-containing protein [Halioglobus sp.]